jgi:spore germination cell wall hydrolase CwlJ-like protein
MNEESNSPTPEEIDAQAPAADDAGTIEAASAEDLQSLDDTLAAEASSETEAGEVTIASL